MANERRVQTNFVKGTVTDNPLTSGATTLNSAGLADLPVIGTGDHAAITLDPQAVGGAPEVVYVTAHTSSATSATILRGREGTTARSHNQGTAWTHAPTATDFLGQVGAGSPEGVVSGGYGRLYLRNDATPTLYVKESSSGTTGWSPVDAGTFKVTVTSQTLGTQSASQSAYTDYTITGICQRGLMSLLSITVNTNPGTLFDLELRDATAGGGNAWLQATDIADGGYTISNPVYIEGDASSNIYIRIKNKTTASRTFTLTSLRVEKFA